MLRGHEGSLLAEHRKVGLQLEGLEGEIGGKHPFAGRTQKKRLKFKQ